jgi:hypothetical protein
VLATPNITQATPERVKVDNVLLFAIPGTGPSDQATASLVTALRQPSLADSMPG